MTTGPYDQDPDNVRGADSTQGSGATPPDPASSGGSPYGSPQYGEPQYGDQQYGNAPYGDAQYGQAPEGGAPYGDSPYGGQTPYGAAPYGDSSYGTPPGYGEPYPTAGYQSYPAAGGANQMSGPGRPADLGVRFGARVIDTLIVGIPMFIIQAIILAAFGTSGGGSSFSLDSPGVGYWVVNAIVSIIFAAVWVAYFVYLETTKGQTLGKQVLHLRVLGASGSNPTRDESLKRNGYVVLLSVGMMLAAIIPFVGPIINWLCYIAALVFVIIIAVTISNSPTKQGKHDEMAGGTQVVTTQ